MSQLAIDRLEKKYDKKYRSLEAKYDKLYNMVKIDMKRIIQEILREDVEIDITKHDDELATKKALENLAGNEQSNYPDFDRCPSCKSPTSIRLNDNWVRCVNCEYEYEKDGE